MDLRDDDRGLEWLIDFVERCEKYDRFTPYKDLPRIFKSLGMTTYCTIDAGLFHEDAPFHFRLDQLRLTILRAHWGEVRDQLKSRKEAASHVLFPIQQFPYDSHEIPRTKINTKTCGPRNESSVLDSMNKDNNKQPQKKDIELTEIVPCSKEMDSKKEEKMARMFVVKSNWIIPKMGAFVSGCYAATPEWCSQTRHSKQFNVNTNPKLVQVLQQIVHDEKIPVERGDIVKLDLDPLGNNNTKCHDPLDTNGILFWNGQKLVLPHEHPMCDRIGVPDEFKVPTEFPLSYWSNVDEHLYAEDGPLCFDVSQLPEMPQKPLFENEDYGYYRIFLRNQPLHAYYIFYSMESKTNMTLFWETGRCHPFYPESRISAFSDEIVAAVKTMKLNPKYVLFVNCCDECGDENEDEDDGTCGNDAKEEELIL
jgi:hypothetical protein